MSDLRLTSNGPALRAQLSYENIPQGARLSWIVYYRPEGFTEWLEPVLLSSFEKFLLLPSGTATKPMYVPHCPTSGECRLDVYGAGKLLASGSAKQQLTTTKLATHFDPVGGIGLCRTESWTFSGDMTGSVDVHHHHTGDRGLQRCCRPRPPSASARSGGCLPRHDHHRRRRATDGYRALPDRRDRPGGRGRPAFAVRLIG